MTDTNGTNDTSRSVATTPESRPRRWDPFAMLSELESEFDRMFGQRLPAFLPLRRYTGALGEGWAPSADVFEKDGDLVVKAELPGVDKDDIEIFVDKGTLVIKGQRKGEEEVREENFYRMERFTGAFSRRFPLPEGVDEDKITADYTDGVLEVRVPKLSAAEDASQVKKISVS